MENCHRSAILLASATIFQFKGSVSDTQSKEAGAKEGFSISDVPKFFNETVDELKKISPPTRAEAMQATIVTIFILVFISAVVALMDLVFGRIMGALI